jgi:hypothetical protein
MVVASWAVANAVDGEASYLIIDSNGLGRGVFDKARQSSIRVLGVNVQSTARDPDRFANIRANMYWNLREDFENGTISIPDDQNLIDQLGAMKYTEDNRGRILIIKKSKLKPELEGESPDEADSLAMSRIYPDTMFVRKRNPNKEGWGDLPDPKGWMSA